MRRRLTRSLHRLCPLLLALALSACAEGSVPPSGGDVTMEGGGESASPAIAATPEESMPPAPVEVFEPYKEWSGNPMLTGIYTADPSARVFGDTIYIYASHDIDPPQGCDLMDKYHVFSSTDLANWQDEGEILAAADVSWGRPEGGFMWAPDCVERDGKYYFYFPHPEKTEWNNSWQIGVAVSDSPVKDFTEIGYVEGLGGYAMIDPNVFIDDDGRVYLYYGGGSRCVGGELNDDMVSMKDGVETMTGLVDFHEAAWVFKRNGIYYMTYADNNSGANQLRYATSDNPLGPWEYKGIYLAPTGCDTSHGSVVEYKGQWYQFYHNQAISGNGTIRSVCADPLYFDEEGNILEVIQSETGLQTLLDPAAEDFGETRLQYEPSARLNDAFAEFTVAPPESGELVRANIRVYYTPQQRNNRIKIVLNGEDLSYINTIAERNYTDVTVKLIQGDNRILLHSEMGSVVVDYITVKFLD